MQSDPTRSSDSASARREPTSRVLIAGAGDVGIRLGLELADAGHQVLALRRDVSRVPKRLTALRADLCDPNQLAKVIPEGLTHIAYCAAADARTDEAYVRAYVQGLSNVLDVPRVRDAALRRVTFISSTAVYSQDDDGWVDESSPTHPTSFSGRRTLEAESLLTESQLPHCILRCGGIYGPGRTRLIDQVRSGTATYDETRADYTNRIHATDVAGALAFLLVHPEPNGLVLGVDHEPARRRDVLRWLAATMGAAPPGKIADSCREGNASPRRSVGSKRVSNAKLVGLGYQFRYRTFREGYGELIRTSC